MAFVVRAFGYRGVVQGKILIPQQDSKDSLFMLHNPYEFRANVTTNGTSPVQLGPSATLPDLATILRVEVPDGSAIRYEVNTPTRVQAADANSPSLIGFMQLEWGPGWYLSVIDAAGT